MNALEFWQAVGPNNGLYCLFASEYLDTWKHLFFETREEAVEKALEADHCVFFGPNSYHPDILKKVDENGDPKITRDQEHALYARSLFVDVDCGKKKNGQDNPYPDTGVGIATLVEKARALGLPKPIILLSGGGVHAYWPLTEDVSVTEWQPVADRLKEALIDEGLQIDDKVTADSARVLRLPGTYNYKRGEPVEVKVITTGKPHSLSYLRNVLGVAEPKLRSDLSAADLLMQGKKMRQKYQELNKKQRDVAKAYGQETKFSFKQILEKTSRGKGCDALGIIATDQENTEYDEWLLGLSIAAKCVNPENTARRISQHYPDYDEDEMLKKIGSFTRGPAACSKFKEKPRFKKACENCDFGRDNKYVRSPLSLGKIPMKVRSAKEVAVKVAEVTGKPLDPLPELLPPYHFGPNGAIYQQTRDRDGDIEDIEVLPYPVFMAARTRENNGTNAVILEVRQPHDPKSEVFLTGDMISRPADFKAALMNKGVVSMNMNRVMEYLMHVIKHSVDQEKALDAASQFGWTDDGAFILGRKKIGPLFQKTKLPPIARNYPTAHTEGYMDRFESKGSLELWKKAIDFFNKPGMEMHQIAICAAMGSPLMHFIPMINSCNLHLYSKGSGVGKTTAMKAGLSIWGNPDEMIAGQKDTQNHMIHYPKVLKNLPMGTDEITNLEGQVFSDLIYLWSDGRDKNKMEVGGKAAQKRGGSWSLITMTTANVSMIEAIEASGYKGDPQGEMQRVLEARILPVGGISKHDTDHMNRTLAENYGHAGIVFISSIMRHDMAKTLMEAQKRLDKELGLTSQNRFWSGFAVCTYIACLLGKQAGLWDFDTNMLKAQLKVLVQDNMAAQKESAITPMDYLQTYLRKYSRSFVRIKGKRMMIGEKELKQNMTASDLPTGTIRGRYEYDTSTLFVVKKDFKHWVAQQQGDSKEVFKWMEHFCEGSSKTVRLASGTQLPNTGAWCVELKGTLIEKLMQDEDDNAEG